MDINNSNIESDNGAYQQLEGTFQALVNAIVPRTPELAELYGAFMYYGALDLLTDQYLIMILNNYYPFMEEALGILLTSLADKNVTLERRERVLYYPRSDRERITSEDWLRVFTLLDHIENGFLELSDLYQEYPEVIPVTGSLYWLTMKGYYSEWFGYGTTRFLSPDKRRFQFIPASWKQINYPGPAVSYIGEIKIFDE